MKEEILIHELAFRPEGTYDKICDAKILVCGVGALGSNLIDNLSRQGFSNITILDYDVVEMHNIGTQTYCSYDLGKSKVSAAQRKLYRDINCEVGIIDTELTNDNTTLLEGYNLIVDTFDNSTARAIVSEYCVDNNIPCVHAGMSDDGYSQVVWNDNYAIPHDNDADDICDYPLARNLALITASLLAEVIMQFIASNEKKNLDFTLMDMKTFLH